MIDFNPVRGVLPRKLTLFSPAIASSSQAVHKMTTYFGYATIPDNAEIRKRKLEIEEVKNLIQNAVPCIDPKHSAIIELMTKRLGIALDIPTNPPAVNFQEGDALIVMSVRGLPRLTGKQRYSHDEAENASFKFSEYKIIQIYSDTESTDPEDSLGLEALRKRIENRFF